MPQYKTAIIGCGRIGCLLEDDPLRPHPCTHAGGYSALKKTHLVAACDINKERLIAFGKRWNVQRLYEDYKDMLVKEDIDIISIASWTETHSQMVIDAACRGIKGIFCEKPIALNLKQADEMLAACNTHKTHLVINHERRWEAPYIKAKGLINSGRIGTIRTIVGNVLCGKPITGDWRSILKRAGGGPLLHDGTHLFDMMRFLAGDVEWVSGHVERRNKDIGVEDIASGQLYFKNGVNGLFESGGLRNYFSFELDIQGSNGRILVGNGISGLWIAEKSRRYSGFSDLVPKPSPFKKKPVNSYIECIRELIKAIEGNGQSCSTGLDGRAALELVMAVYESARLNGARVTLPLLIKQSPLEIMFEEGKL
ncbi:MAG: Gfo/Idh/MocA family oxidoreductase [bacterium]